MQVFEHVVGQPIREILPKLSWISDSFYLGGGTGLALQIGHRKSEDLDFFSDQSFDENRLVRDLSGIKVIQQYRGTVHGVLNGVRLSFLHYPVPLMNATHQWKGIKIASLPDLVAEKFKTVSQRGAKKDFCDLFAVFKSGISIEQGCHYLKKRFESSGIQFYSVLKGLTYFEDAESDPDPIWFQPEYSIDWEDIKTFFRNNIGLFEKELFV